MPAIFGKTLALATVVFSALACANAQTVKGVINLSGAPEGIAVDYLTNTIYAAVPSFGGPTDTLAVIDGIKDKVIKNISIPPVGYQVAVDVVLDRIYVGGCYTDNNGNNVCEVAVVNGLTNKLVNTIFITNTEGYGIQGLAVNALTGKLYVANASDNVIDVVDCLSSKISSVISLDGESPSNITVNPFANKLYVALATNLVDVIDTTQNAITATPTVGTVNQGIAVNWLTGNVFVTNNIFGISTVGVLNGSGSLITNVTAGNTPFGVDLDLITNLAFVTNTTDFSLSVIDGRTNTVKETLPVSGTYVAVNPLTSKVYVSGQTNIVTVVKEK